MSPERPWQSSDRTFEPASATRTSGGRRRAPRARIRPFWFGVCVAVFLASLGALLVSTLPSATALRTQGDREPVTSAEPTSNRAGRLGATRLDAAELVLDRQERAIAHRDKDAYLATIDPHHDNEKFTEVAGRTFDNVSRMRVDSFEYGTLTEDPGGLTPQRREQLGGSDAFVAETTVRFRLQGPDRPNRWSTTLRLVFVERAGKTYLANDREGRATTDTMPLWLDDSVDVVRGEHSLVIGAASAERLESYARTADRAVPRVTEVWGKDWEGYLVLIVPRTQGQMERAIGADPDSQAAVAAVTTSVGRADPGTASHIVVNPKTFADVGSLGRMVVLSHETTHVATHATVSTMPIWLSEGFADYVGFHRSGLPTSRVARELFATVREDGPPDALPDSADFDPQAPDLDQAYESAWLACRYIAWRWGEDTLVELYAEMDGASSPAEEDQVLDQVLGITIDDFTADWRAYVASLADGG